ncbi:MAG: serine hydrolase domain-containing protein [Saprospiraceae bacterium]
MNLRNTILTVLLLLAFSTISNAQAKRDLSTKCKEYLDQLHDFSGTILIAQHDSILVKRAFGNASIEYNIKNEVDTKFNIASITKMITSVAVLQLFEQGKLKMDAVVGTYLPDYPNSTVRDSVTIEQLLTHTSGLQPFYGGNYLESNKLNYKKVSDYLPLFVNEPLAFSPGTSYKYNGAGFVILGLIIEKITGMDYYDYIDQNVFKKAGMKNSLAIETDSIVSNKASGYTSTFGDKNYYSRNDYYLSKASPAGSHYSTVEDLYLFSRALRNNLFFSENTKEMMLTPRVKGYNTHLGYGVDIDQRYSEVIFGHSGGWFGVRTELMDFKDSGITIVVLSNFDDNGKTGASKVIDDLKEMIGGKIENN